MNIAMIGDSKSPNSFIASLNDIGRLRVLLGLCLGVWGSLVVRIPNYSTVLENGFKNLSNNVGQVNRIPRYS